MAYIPNRDDPFMPPPAPSAEELRRQARLESELQADPELREGPVSSGRGAMYAIAILAVLGALFYGLNVANNSSQTASGPTAPSNMAQTNPANPQPLNRNVTPTPNSAPGVTTGAAPSSPAPAK